MLHYTTRRRLCLAPPPRRSLPTPSLSTSILSHRCNACWCRGAGSEYRDVIGARQVSSSGETGPWLDGPLTLSACTLVLISVPAGVGSAAGQAS